MITEWSMKFDEYISETTGQWVETTISLVNKFQNYLHFHKIKDKQIYVVDFSPDLNNLFRPVETPMEDVFSVIGATRKGEYHDLSDFNGSIVAEFVVFETAPEKIDGFRKQISEKFPALKYDFRKIGGAGYVCIETEPLKKNIVELDKFEFESILDVYGEHLKKVLEVALEHTRQETFYEIEM
ncbi:MAG TPA: hypothetical protein ENN60_00360 [archaeon]|nr:hypothetical protein [archaeon]